MVKRKTAKASAVRILAALVLDASGKNFLRDFGRLNIRQINAVLATVGRGNLFNNYCHSCGEAIRGRTDFVGAGTGVLAQTDGLPVGGKKTDDRAVD